MKSPSNECGSMLLLYLYINIPVSLSYPKMFSVLYLSNKGFDGDTYGLFEIVCKARFSYKSCMAVVDLINDVSKASDDDMNTVGICMD